MKKEFRLTSPEGEKANLPAEGGVKTIDPRYYGKAPVNIGGRRVWVKACAFENGHKGGPRCLFAATVKGMCPWHNYCVQSHGVVGDYIKFLDWRERENDPRWDGDPLLLWQCARGETEALEAFGVIS